MLKAGALRARASTLRRRLPTRVWVLLTVALVLRVAVVGGTLFTPTTFDPADFSRTGLSIAQGHGYPDTNRAPGGGPSAFRPPAYPAFLGAVYAVAGQEAPGAARMVETLLGTLSVALVGLIATRIWGRRIGVMALGIAAVAPPMVVLSTTLISESLFVPLMLGAVATALQVRRSPHPWRWVIFTGVLVGIAELTRTNAIVLLASLAFAIGAGSGLSRRRAVLRASVLALVSVLTVAPWTLRNWFVLHTFVPVSTEIGYTVAGTYNLASRADHHWPAVWKEAEHGASSEYAPILFYASIYRWNEVTLDNHLLSAAFKDIRRDPSYMLTVVAWNAVRMFHLGELDFGVANLRDTDVPKVPAILEVAGFYLLGLLALGGLAARGFRRAPLWLWLVPMLLATTLFITGFVRFRAGIDPFLAMLAALGMISLMDRWRARRVQGAAAAEDHETPGSDGLVGPPTASAPAALALMGG